MIVDQFEQLLRSAERNEQADRELEHFVAVLSDLTAGPVLTATILGVRLDFLTAVMYRNSLRKLIVRDPIFVGPMSDEELAEVALRPARSKGVNPETGFVELVLREISARDGRAAHQAGGTLPLLSRALHMTWKRGDGKVMTIANCRAVGGVDGAVLETAKNAYDSLGEAQREIARRMFLALVHVHSSGIDIRRKVTEDDLLGEIGGDIGEARAVLETFVTHRLVTVDQDTVEITHESVMLAWPKLQGWLTAYRNSRIVAQKTIADARDWDKAGRPADVLYTGPRLQTALDLRKRLPADIPELSGQFLDAAVRRSQRATRRLQATVALLTVLFLVAAGLAVFAYNQAETTRIERDQAQSRTLAGRATALRDKDVALSRQLALAAFRISPTVEARSALIDATSLRPAVRMHGFDGAGLMYAVGLHPDGAVAAAAAENTVRLFDVGQHGHPSPLPTPPNASCTKIYALAYSPNGLLLAASCSDGTVHLWDTRNPRSPVELPTITIKGAKIYSVAFSPDSSMVGVAVAQPTGPTSYVGDVRLWSVSGTTVTPLGESLRVSDSSPTKSISFRPGNGALAVGMDDGTVQIWDITNPAKPADPVTATGPTKAIGQLAFSPDGTKLAAGGADRLVHLWDTTNSRTPRYNGEPIAGVESWINALSFSPDGGTLAAASSDSREGVRLVDLSTRRVTATMPHPSVVTSVKFSASGDTLITGANDGIARLWPVTSTPVEGMAYTVSATKFSPDGTTLSMGSSDLRLLDMAAPRWPALLAPPEANQDGFSGTLAYAPNGTLIAEGHGKSGQVQLWNVTDRTKPKPHGQPLQAHSKQVETVAINRTSTLLATGSRDGLVRLWDISNPTSPTPLFTPGTFGGFVNEVAFSPSGDLLLAGSVDKTVRMWNIADPRKPVPTGPALNPANHYVWSAIFSPHGRTLVISLANSTVVLYDITDPAEPKLIGKPLTGPADYVNSLSYSTDGKLLAASAGDGTLWIWNVERPAEPSVHATLSPGEGALFPVQFQPNTKLLVSGGDENKAWFWTVDTDAAASLICDTSGDAITRDEWTKYVQDRPYSPPCR